MKEKCFVCKTDNGKLILTDMIHQDDNGKEYRCMAHNECLVSFRKQIEQDEEPNQPCEETHNSKEGNKVNTVFDIIMEHLIKNDYDGLVNYETAPEICSCSLSNLFECGAGAEMVQDCQPGTRKKCNDCKSGRLAEGKENRFCDSYEEGGEWCIQ